MIIVNPQPKTNKLLLEIVTFELKMIIKKENCYR